MDGMEENIFEHNATLAVGSESNTTTIAVSSSLSPEQEAVVAFLPILPSLLSIAGSVCIIRLVHRKKYRAPYRRLLFGLSAYDVFSSLFVPLQSFLVDKETSRRRFAVGNEATCNFLGWGFQASCGCFLYFGALSTYYLMVVRFGVKDEYFARRIEPFMHGFIILYSLGTAFAALGENLYGEQEIGAGCHLAPNESCDSACIANLALILIGIPYVFILVLVLANNLTIYCYVRRTVRQYVKNSQDRAEQNLSSGLVADPNVASNRDGSVDLDKPIEETAAVSSKVKTKIAEVENQQKQVQLVRTQSILYSAAFILAYMWTLILRAAISYTEGEPGPEMEADLYLFMVFRAIFTPSMGFWSFFIYIRPRYLQLRRQTKESRLQTLVRVMQDDDIRSIRSSLNNRGSAYHSNKDSRYSESRRSETR
ncbi:unnamed protein product [Cylindrotheca closterium]|uniref:G-protein coupled receptors family 1 profile domain-containing protein n=1 Tax=Cylindrotheca closterium TaxID=2856 RepID=A0AAD2FS91_9STRA|nr:unnamed protein product [Cylindrotheca closterium]